MDAFGWFITAIVAVNVIRAIAKGSAETPTKPLPPKGPRPVQARSGQSRAPKQSDQVEVWRQVFAQIQATAETPRHLPARPSKWEEGVSLEVVPPEVVDYDEEAQAVVQRRIDAAQARDNALTAKDHGAFDARIREAGPVAPVRPTMSVAELRRAFVWREVLGPPVGLRE